MWQDDVPATTASRVNASLSLFAAVLGLLLSSFKSTFAPTVPIHPAYASITALPMATPGSSPRSLAAFSHKRPDSSPAFKCTPFYSVSLQPWNARIGVELDATYLAINTPNTMEPTLSQVTQSYLLQKVLLPALVTPLDAMWQIRLLADHAGEATRIATRRDMGQRIPQVIEAAFGKHLAGHVILEPQDLGDFHFQ